jgi:hypothetical protein
MRFYPGEVVIMKSKLLVLAFLAVATWLGPVSAHALSFNFSFTNSTVPETVTGVITGLVDNSVSSATSVQVTSNTAGFGLGEYVGSPVPNSFTVSGGVITFYLFQSFGESNTSPAVTCCSLGLLENVAALSNSPGLIFYGGVVTRVTFTPVTPVGVPGPIVGAGLPGLVMAFGGLVAWARRRRLAA